MSKIDEFRALVFDGIETCLRVDGHCKSYEGTVEVKYPNYFERTSENQCVVTLHCYVLGPSRHYTWFGTTLDEALDRAFADVRQWVDDAKKAEVEDANA
jgi:hypothetical protein